MDKIGFVAFFITFLLFVGVFLISKKEKKLTNPLLLFLGLWSFVLLLSSLGLYNITDVSDQAYFAILWMVVSFVVGYSFFYIYKSKKSSIEDGARVDRKNEDCLYFKDFRTKVYLGLCLLLIVFNIIDCVLVIKYIADGVPAWQVRNWSLEPFGSSNPILDRRTFLEDIFRSVVLSPLAILIPPITAFVLFRSKEKKLKYSCVAIALLATVTSSIAGAGGRLGIVYLTGCFLLAYVLFRKKNKQSFEKKNRNKLIAVVLAAFLAVIGFTTLRTAVGNMVKQTYTYFAVPPTLLSEWIPEIEKSPHTYGLTSFFGFHSYIFRGMKTVGVDEMVPGLYDDSFANILNAEKFRPVGYGTANAFVTPVYYFWADGGLPFVILASILFGIICAYMQKKYSENKNRIMLFVFYTLMMYGVFLSFIRIQTVSPSYVLAFLFAFVLFWKKRKEVGESE